MKGLPTKYFGPNGIPCLFATDKSGNISVGYFVKQLGTFKFVASNGDVTMPVRLAQTSSEMANLPFGLCTILVTALDEPTENIKYIVATRCTTVQGNDYPWHIGSPTFEFASITTPNVSIAGSLDFSIASNSGYISLI